jgi:hypothetical protein
MLTDILRACTVRLMLQWCHRLGSDILALPVLPRPLHTRGRSSRSHRRRRGPIEHRETRNGTQICWGSFSAVDAVQGKRATEACGELRRLPSGDHGGPLRDSLVLFRELKLKRPYRSVYSAQIGIYAAYATR